MIFFLFLFLNGDNQHKQMKIEKMFVKEECCYSHGPLHALGDAEKNELHKEEVKNMDRSIEIEIHSND